MARTSLPHLAPTHLRSATKRYGSTRDKRNGRCANNDRFEAKPRQQFTEEITNDHHS